MSNPEQNNLPEAVEKRRPVAAGHCLFKIALTFAYGCALMYIALHPPGWELPFLGFFLALFGVCALVQFLKAMTWVLVLCFLRRGEQVEYVFTPVQKHDSTARIAFDLFTVIGSAFGTTIITLQILSSIHYLPSFMGGCLLLLLNLAAWRGVYHAFTRDRAYMRYPGVTLSAKAETSLSAPCETVESDGAKAPIAVTNGAGGTARHWWTDTQAREEAKVTAQR